MPLGFERVNERTQRPNANINFIKPLTSASPADQKFAQDFLERIAAQCFPIMKTHYLYVMALEQFPANNEFLGRNFNAGEVIQLVLKDKAGHWLSFKFVQMVMMHELAHCKQMNHSRFFWKERNVYADSMKELWQNGYTGEGLWGRGKDLISGRIVNDRMPAQGDVPEHLCGGTYRRAGGRKRKRGQDGEEKTTVSFAERQQKRIARKFGKHGDGNALGEDDMVRGALEHGKRHYGKPRVAQSKRGRELRANAALARFEAAKNQAANSPSTSEPGEDSETDWSSDDGVYSSSVVDPSTVIDRKGGSMVQVCGDEGEQDEGGEDEMNELRLMKESKERKNPGSPKPGKITDRLGIVSTSIGERVGPIQGSETESETEDAIRAPAIKNEPIELQDDSDTESESDEEEPTGGIELCTETINNNTPGEAPDTTLRTVPGPSENPTVDHKSHAKPGITTQQASNMGPAFNVFACQICSLENEQDSPTCMACSHVLKPSLMRNHWRCKSEACKGSKYINPGDAGRCGLCGAQKPTVLDNRKPIGVVEADVLRWD